MAGSYPGFLLILCAVVAVHVDAARIKTRRSESACVRNDDCDANPWCKDDNLIAWCPSMAATCPGPHCTFTGTPTPGPTPVPPTPRPLDPTPPPTPLPPGKIDIIGYYGNSGLAVPMIPKFSDVHENYNVIILTFASISASGELSLDIQGPYEKDFDSLAADLKAWKATPDKWGRKRLALISIGGQNGRWPSGVSIPAFEAGLDKFMGQFGLDGLDIDLEGGCVAAAVSLVPVIQNLKSKGKIVTAAPEAAQFPLEAYKDMLKHLTWVHPQFYNNGPNAVTTPWVPTDTAKWPTPWTVANWQAESQGEAYWAAVLKEIGHTTGLTQNQLGMLFPATPKAASTHNRWDIDNLARQVANAGVTHVGHWALAYDHENRWKAAIALGKLNGPSLVGERTPHH